MVGQKTCHLALKTLLGVLLLGMLPELCPAQQLKRVEPIIAKFQRQSRGMGILQGEVNASRKAQLHIDLLDFLERQQMDVAVTETDLLHYIDQAKHIIRESQRELVIDQANLYRNLQIQIETLTKAYEFSFRDDEQRLNQLTLISQDLVGQILSSSQTQFIENENVQQFDRYSTRLQQVLESERQLNGYSGSLTSSYVSQISERRNQTGADRETYLVSLATNINRDIYPGELNFNSQLQVNIDGNTFQEQVTNLFMSYDHDIARPNKLGRELFSYVSRYSNSYLDVIQRYEGGVGYVHDFQNDNLRGEGTGNRNKINRLREDLNQDLKLGGRVQKCSEQLCQVYPDFANLSPADSASIDEFLQHTLTTNRKKYRKHRFGFLLGGFVELEQIGVPDSISFSRTEGDITVAPNFTFEAVQRTRLVARLHYHGYFANNISLKVRPYFIFPAWPFADYHVRYTKADGSVIKFADTRIKVEADLSADFGQASFGLGIVYNYDQAPTARLIQVGSEELLYSAPNSHFLTQASFTYKF